MAVVLELREIEPDDLPRLQELIEGDPGYAERVTGHPPGPSDALSLTLIRPEGLPEEAKVVLGAWDSGFARLAAVVDLVRGYPSEGRVFVGLLQVRVELQRQGVGREVWRLAEEWVRSRWPEATTARLAVVDTTAAAAEPFW
ncbi:MAG: GNAT family N-acetyltransferase, partial [Propionibacteriales bacterium]|nr:GNAT family N-acetyltransferase [Propionibacteriales bacterium]